MENHSHHLKEKKHVNISHGDGSEPHLLSTRNANYYRSSPAMLAVIPLQSYSNLIFQGLCLQANRNQAT